MESDNKQDQIRVLKVIEYSGDRAAVEEHLNISFIQHGTEKTIDTRRKGRLTIRGAILGTFPELLQPAVVLNPEVVPAPPVDLEPAPPAAPEPPSPAPEPPFALINGVRYHVGDYVEYIGEVTTVSAVNGNAVSLAQWKGKPLSNLAAPQLLKRLGKMPAPEPEPESAPAPEPEPAPETPQLILGGILDDGEPLTTGEYLAQPRPAPAPAPLQPQTVEVGRLSTHEPNFVAPEALATFESDHGVFKVGDYCAYNNTHKSIYRVAKIEGTRVWTSSVWEDGTISTPTEDRPSWYRHLTPLPADVQVPQPAAEGAEPQP